MSERLKYQSYGYERFSRLVQEPDLSEQLIQPGQLKDTITDTLGLLALLAVSPTFGAHKATELALNPKLALDNLSEREQHKLSISA